MHGWNHKSGFHSFLFNLSQDGSLFSSLMWPLRTAFCTQDKNPLSSLIFSSTIKWSVKTRFTGLFPMELSKSTTHIWRSVPGHSWEGTWGEKMQLYHRPCRRWQLRGLTQPSSRGGLGQCPVGHSCTWPCQPTSSSPWKATENDQESEGIKNAGLAEKGSTD